MSDLAILLFSGLAGLALGGVFFGGLWWTIRRAVGSPRPGLWFALSLPLRMGVTLLGFYLVAGGRWERTVACLAGFLVARAASAVLMKIPEARRAP